jgi:septum formation protein
MAMTAAAAATTATTDDESPPSLSTREWILLTGDQVVTCHGKILEKPETIDEARAFVQLYQTHPPSTVGSCVLTHWPSGLQVSGVDTATIYFQSNIPTTLIDDLVALKEPILSCAGGLMIEHDLTKQYLKSIDGTEDSVMGLSKDLVWRLLQELADKLKHRNE